MTKEEKRMFELMDRLAEEDVLEENLPEPPDFSPMQSGEPAAITRIKERTLSLAERCRIEGQISFSRSSRKRNMLVWAATAAVLLLIIATIGNSAAVQAELKKVLRFLPGIGAVQEGDVEQTTYVLEKPYVETVGEGSLTIDGIVLQREGAEIVLRGRNVPEVEEFEVIIEGRSYTFRYFARTSAVDWYGHYAPVRGTRLPVSDEVTLHMNGITIGPLKLVLPKTADELEQLGASDEQQGIRVTAFPTVLGDGLVRIQLIPKLQDEGQSVDSYGVSPLVRDAGLYVEDADGTIAEIPGDDRMSHHSDFRFREIEGGKGPYTIVIPYLEVSDRNAKSDSEVKLPIPPIGSSLEVDVTTVIRGLPVNFTRIERTGASSVSVDVDIHFDTSEPQSLKYFLIRYAGFEYNESFGWKYADEGFGPMETLSLEIKPDQTELRFSLVEPHVIVKGPWRLPVETP